MKYHRLILPQPRTNHLVLKKCSGYIYMHAITFFGEAPRSAYGCRCEGAARLARLRLDLQAATAV
jgi:hypothetical protein